MWTDAEIMEWKRALVSFRNKARCSANTIIAELLRYRNEDHMSGEDRSICLRAMKLPDVKARGVAA